MVEDARPVHLRRPRIFEGDDGVKRLEKKWRNLKSTGCVCLLTG